MTRLARVAAIFLVLVFFPASVRGASESILLVLLDDHGVDKLGLYGEGGACSVSGAACAAPGDCPGAETCVAAYPPTPTLDGLRAEGILFRNAWTAPVCTPTRATVLTGRHAFRTGVFAVGDTLPAGEQTLAEVLAGAGYATASIGKWHLGGTSFAPLDQGFDHYIGDLAGGVGDYFDWDRTDNGNTEPCFVGSPACPAVAYATEVNVNDAVSWVQGQGGPWFLYLAYNAPHAPFHVPPHHLLSAATLAGLPQSGGMPAPEGTACSGAQRRTCYAAAVEAADAELGRLLQAAGGPVTVIVMGDNGTPAAVTQPPFDPAHAKGTVYEGGVNVPLIIRPAAPLAAPLESRALVHSSDLFATVLELAGTVPPADRAVDGRSLLPLIADPEAPFRQTIYTRLATPRAVRDHRFKLIRTAGGEELYDLEGRTFLVPADPFETTDLLDGSLTLRQQEAHADLSLAMDVLEGSCDPLDCGAVAVTCATEATLLHARTPAAQGVTFGWTGVPGTASYDVVRGDIDLLRSTRGDYAQATGTCLADSAAGTSVTDAVIPADGAAFWYLVRPSASPCNGSYGGGTDRPGYRDHLIAAAPGACP